MSLDCMTPAEDWDDSSQENAVKTLASLDPSTTFRVWGADWCPDCTSQLPAFAAALERAKIADDRVHVYPVEREDGVKHGEKMDEYDVSRIPTVVVEDADGDELARFVEAEDEPITEFLADELVSLEA